MIQKCFTHELGSKPLTIRSKTEFEFFIEIKNEKESKTIVPIKKITNIELDIWECENINQWKCLVYIYDWNDTESDFEQYTQHLINKFKLVNVEKAF